MMQPEKEKNSTQDNARNQWTQEQRINAGQIAAQALNSPIFSVVHDLLIQRHFREFQLSDPKEENLRRSLYYKQKALKDTMLEMASMVGEAQRIIAARHAENDPVEQDRQRMEEQGFGLNFNQEMS
jgi:hypothetical protein